MFATKQNDLSPLNWPVIIGFWLLIIGIFVGRTLLGGAGILLITDTDDAMRMVVAQDFLAGQGWFDHTQYRLNTPQVADIHWSRLVDLPIAGLLWVLQPFFGEFAVVLTAWIWPLLLLLILFILSVRITTYFVGPEGLFPGLVLPVLSAAILIEFSPGRLDHHNVQIILVLALLYASIRAWTAPRWALMAGGIAATSIAIGLEALPQIITVVSVFGLFYAYDKNRGKTARLFGLAFAGSTLVHLLVYLPPHKWLPASCDALSLVYVSAAIGVGLVFTILSFLQLKQWFMRLLAGGVLGVALVAVLLLIFPECAKGPYGAIDPWLVENWLSKVTEAKPVWHSLRALPGYTLGVIIPPIVALIILLVFIKRTPDDKRVQWAILALFIFTSLVVVMAQVRGARLVAGMVTPVGAWAILRVRQHYLKTNSILAAFALISTWLLFSGLALAVAIGFLVPQNAPNGTSSNKTALGGETLQLSKSDCIAPKAFEDIASLPPERIMAPVDLGAHLLLFTPHSVVGAPYHRNQFALMDTFGFFNLPIDEARAILRQRGISLIVTCPYLSEMNGFDDADASSFVHAVKSGHLPDWVHEVTLPGAILQVFAVID